MGGIKIKQERAAHNQSLFRDINENVEHLNHALGELSGPGAWVCECANPVCTELIRASMDQYEAVRADATRFLVAPGDKHVFAEVERIVERREAYWVVEKFGEAATVAGQLDPRAVNAG